MMDPLISFTPPSGTHVGPLKIIFKGVKKLGHTHARADHPAHARADHPSTMKREEMHTCADLPAQCQPAPLIVLSQAHCKNAVEKAYSFVGRGSDVGVQT